VEVKAAFQGRNGGDAGKRAQGSSDDKHGERERTADLQ
jgi:hypothetical protein